MRLTFTLFLVLAFPACVVPSALAQDCSPGDLKFLTGPEHSYYNNVGKAIREVALQQGLRLCLPVVKSTLDNVSELEAGHASFGLVQSDVAHDAWYGHAPAFPQRTQNVRLVMPLYTEAVHILLRPHLSLARLSDLKGKKIWLGLPDSGTEYTARHLLASVGIASASPDVSPASYSNYCDAVEGLKQMELDAFFRVTLVPSVNIQDAVREPKQADERCVGTTEIQVVSLDYDLVDRLVKDGSYIETLIPSAAYGLHSSALTVGVQALLLSGRKDGDVFVAQLATLLRTKRPMIEAALERIVEQDHPGHSHSRNVRQLSLLDVPPSPAFDWVTDSTARQEFYNPWRDSWQPLWPFMLLGVLSVVPLLMWKKLAVATALVRRPQVTLAVSATILIWLINACLLYRLEYRVNELFNSFPRSILSSFLCLLSFPGLGLLTRNGQSTLEITKWVSLLLFGGFIGPQVKQALEGLFRSLVCWCEKEAAVLQEVIVAPASAPPSTAIQEVGRQVFEQNGMHAAS